MTLILEVAGSYLLGGNHLYDEFEWVINAIVNFCNTLKYACLHTIPLYDLHVTMASLLTECKLEFRLFLLVLFIGSGEVRMIEF